MGTAASLNRPYVLLTGATGLVGGLVLANLQSHEIPTAVLVRGNRRQSAGLRAELLMQRLEQRLGRRLVRPVVLAGNLDSPALGLSDIDFAWLSQNCGRVIHSAANLLFRPASEHPDNEPYRTNVDGTRFLLNVATHAGIDEWHYVSTAYIAGLRTGRISETESDVGQAFGNDYERSKTIAETMLRRTAGLQSLTVYRPSIVIDLHPTTSMRSDQTINSAFVMFQALSQRFGLPERGEWFQRLGFSGHERKNIVTVDWVAAMISQIFRRPALHGRTYHLTSPTGTSASELEDGFRAAVEFSGLRIPPRRSEAMSQIDEQAAPFVAAFKPYFRDDPMFDRTNTEMAMKICGEADLPVLTAERLRDFCLRQTKPVLPVTEDRSPQTGWSRFIHSMQQKETGPGTFHLSVSSQQELRNRLSDAGTVMGLALTGPGGGEWQVQFVRHGLQISEAPTTGLPVRWLASAADFDTVISGQLSASEAIQSGRLLLEFGGVEVADEYAAAGTDRPSEVQTFVRTAREILETFAGEVRRAIPCCQVSSSEVTHVH